MFESSLLILDGVDFEIWMLFLGKSNYNGSKLDIRIKTKDIPLEVAEEMRNNKVGYDKWSMQNVVVILHAPVMQCPTFCCNWTRLFFILHPLLKELLLF